MSLNGRRRRGVCILVLLHDHFASGVTFGYILIYQVCVLHCTVDRNALFPPMHCVYMECVWLLLDSVFVILRPKPQKERGDQHGLLANLVREILFCVSWCSPVPTH